MKMKPLFQAATFTALALLMINCGGGDGTGQKQYNYERADSLSTDYLKELGSVRINIESAAKLYATLQDKDYAYDESLITSPSKSFSTSKQQAMGLGMYSAGLAYSTVFSQNQNATEYMKSIVALSEKLGIPEAFDKDILEKLASADTTINKSVLLTKAYIKATDQLYSEERAQLVTMMVAGGFIEGLLISTGAVKDKKIDKEIGLGIYEQVYSYENTLKMLEVFKDNSDVGEVYTIFEEVKPTMEECIHSHGKLTSKHINKLHAALTQLKGKLI